MSNAFHFKQFTVKQEKSAFKVGTDGVLLGAWAQCHHAKRILDIGTGTGVIALMLAQRSKAKIDAIEIDTASAKEAANNFEASKWEGRLACFNIPIQDFKPPYRYGLIVSNPPYFTNSMKPNNTSKSQARHDISLTKGDLFAKAKSLLEPYGLFSVVIPSQNSSEVYELADANTFYLKRKTNVLPTPKTKAKRLLLEFSLVKTETQSCNLVIEEGVRHVYSKKYIALTKDFYLNM